MLLKLMAIIQKHMAAGHMCSPPPPPPPPPRLARKGKQLFLCFILFSGYPLLPMDFNSSYSRNRTMQAVLARGKQPEVLGG